MDNQADLELWELIRRIPPGRVASYGALGRALSRPLSGYLVGRAMARSSPDVPWWRVVDRHGRFAVNKRDPAIAEEQLRRLRQENTPFADETTVAPEAFVDPDELIA